MRKQDKRAMPYFFYACLLLSHSLPFVYWVIYKAIKDNIDGTFLAILELACPPIFALCLFFTFFVGVCVFCGDHTSAKVNITGVIIEASISVLLIVAYIAAYAFPLGWDNQIVLHFKIAGWMWSMLGIMDILVFVIALAGYKQRSKMV